MFAQLSITKASVSSFPLTSKAILFPIVVCGEYWQLDFGNYRQKLNSFGNCTMHLSPHPHDDSTPSHPEAETLFEKYKLGLAHLNAPFRLFDSASSTSCEEEWDSEEQPGAERRARGPYRKYTIEEKIQAVQRIMNGEDVKLISREFGIPRRNLLRWKKNGCERKEGGGRPTDAALEQLIHDKIKRQELTDERTIRNFAIEYSRTSSFKASKGWFVKFCHRFGISLDFNIESPSPLPLYSSSPLPFPEFAI